ncbi:glycosyltransferase family 25 protein [Dongia deserti]|uniref:glycosyltransferase family 25 protein n=1 Tax=Dongia deserti TaxID=2268030 RepID=UPI000E65E445|nr:glycosyltransferase family 25 protein [Dongia deserti]
MGIIKRAMEWMNPKPELMTSVVRTKIIVVSLADAEERRSRFRERAQNAPVAWDFYPARTSLHPALSYDEQAAIVAKGRPLRAAELGCFSSHYAAWEDLQSDEADQYVVLEDDVIVDWTFLSKLAEIALTEMGINYLRLYYKFPTTTAVVREDFIERARSIVELGGPAYGTQGYAITKAGAKVFLDHCRTVTRPIDDEMDRAWVHGQPNLAVFPFPVMEEFSGSTIGNARFEKFDVPQHLKLKRLVHYRVERLRRDASKAIRRFQRFWERQLSKT